MKLVGGKHKYTYWTDNEERASHLLRLIRLAHQLQLQLTRTTDSRLQRKYFFLFYSLFIKFIFTVPPAFRQDFPTLKRAPEIPTSRRPGSTRSMKQKPNENENPSTIVKNKSQYENLAFKESPMSKARHDAIKRIPSVKKCVSLDVLSAQVSTLTTSEQMLTSSKLGANSESHLHTVAPVRL